MPPAPVAETSPVPVFVSGAAEKVPRSVELVGGASAGGFSGAGGKDLMAQAAADVPDDMLWVPVLDTVPVSGCLVPDAVSVRENPVPVLVSGAAEKSVRKVEVGGASLGGVAGAGGRVLMPHAAPELETRLVLAAEAWVLDAVFVP